jgi:hypothetical protein
MARALFGSIWSFLKFIWSSIIIVTIVQASIALASDDNYRNQLVKTTGTVLSWIISHPWSWVALIIFAVITPISGLLAWAAKTRDENIKQLKTDYKLETQVYRVRVVE